MRRAKMPRMGDIYRQEALATANALRSLSTTIEVSPAPRTAARMSTEWLPQTAGRLAALAQLAEAARWVPPGDPATPPGRTTEGTWRRTFFDPAVRRPVPLSPDEAQVLIRALEQTAEGAPEDVAAELSDLAGRLRLAWTPDEWETHARSVTGGR
jgi:hypothetical protein